MATVTTNQETKRIIVPGEPEVRPYTVYAETYTWTLDATTGVPLGVAVERTPL